LRICQRLNYLEKGMHIYYGHRLNRRMFRRWLRYLDTKYTYETPLLAEDCRQRIGRLQAFSIWLKQGGNWHDPAALIYRWMEYTQRKVLKRRIVATLYIRRYVALIRIAFNNFKACIQIGFDPERIHFLERRADWDIKLLDSRRLDGPLWSDQLRIKQKGNVAARTAKARQMRSLETDIKVLIEEVLVRIKGEQALLLQLFEKRNRGMECVVALHAIRNYLCVSDELSLRTLEAFRVMDTDTDGKIDPKELRRVINILPRQFGRHNAERVIEWVTAYGTHSKYFTFPQWEKAFVPYTEISEIQQVEVLRRRKYEVLLAMDHCFELARNMFAGRIPAAKEMGLTHKAVCLGIANWLFRIKSRRLPKVPKGKADWEFPSNSHYRDHVDSLCQYVQNANNYG